MARPLDVRKLPPEVSNLLTRAIDIHGRARVCEECGGVLDRTMRRAMEGHAVARDTYMQLCYYAGDWLMRHCEYIVYRPVPWRVRRRGRRRFYRVKVSFEK